MIVTKAVITGIGGPETASTGQTAPPPAGWPMFKHQRVLTDKETLKYKPTHEFVFPSVFHAGVHLKEPLAEWYLYYAPHNDPGGVCLLYAESIEGPWTEYANNPVITNNWAGYTCPHVSSPEATWNEQAGRLFVYYHGSNSITRWAETDDGVRFDYGGIAVQDCMAGPDVTESSYARVFPHPDRSSGFAYAMFYMANEKDNVRRIRLAESKDGRSWKVDTKQYIVEPGPVEGQNVSGANLFPWKGQLYVIYHASSGNIYARTIDMKLRSVGSTPILLYKASGHGADAGRVASPQVVTYNGQTYLFYESGDRLGATIAWAKAT